MSEISRIGEIVDKYLPEENPRMRLEMKVELIDVMLDVMEELKGKMEQLKEEVRDDKLRMGDSYGRADK